MVGNVFPWLYTHCFVCVFQTGCSPASAFASFSKHPASPPKAGGMNRSTSGVSDTSSDTMASNILSAPQSVCLSSESPPRSPLDGDVVIPCEFCGVALEEAVVFHHQVCQLQLQEKGLKVVIAIQNNDSNFVNDIQQ